MPQRLVQRLLRPSRFAWLMALLAENHGRLVRLFDPASLPLGSYRSEVGGDPVLRVDVLERCRYTIILGLSHLFADGDDPASLPEALLRLYLDARVCEILAHGSLLPPRPAPPAAGALQRKIELNIFLAKWLEFLKDRGHSRQTLEPWLTAPSLSRGRLVACE
jgi:uncharacterized protein YqiB (DUF1249 family)